MTKYYPGDVPCGRCDAAILPSENRFSGQDEDGSAAIIICQECRDLEHTGIIQKAEEGPRP